MTAVLATNIAPTLTPGRSPPRPARAVFKDPDGRSQVSCDWSQTRRIDVPQVAYFSSGVLA